MKQNDFIEKVAGKIQHLGLATPLVLLLEAHKPVAFLGSQLLLIAQPTLDIFLPRTFSQNSIDLLSHSDQLEQLITRLQTKRPPPPWPQDGQVVQQSALEVYKED